MTDRKVKRLTPNSIANLVMADEAWHDSLYVRAEDYDSLLADFEHLRTHLAAEQPKQEPVAWQYKGEPSFDGNRWYDNYQVTTSEQVAKFKDKNARPLYTALATDALIAELDKPKEAQP